MVGMRVTNIQTVITTVSSATTKTGCRIADAGIDASS